MFPYGIVCVSLCRCCVFVSVVHPVAIPSAVFCVIIIMFDTYTSVHLSQRVNTVSLRSSISHHRQFSAFSNSLGMSLRTLVSWR